MLVYVAVVTLHVAGHALSEQKSVAYNVLVYIRTYMRVVAIIIVYENFTKLKLVI